MAEIVEYHCNEVNPRELVISTDFIKNMNDTSLYNVPLVKMYLLFTQYTDDKVRQQNNGPSISQFLDCTTLTNLCQTVRSWRTWRRWWRTCATRHFQS